MAASLEEEKEQFFGALYRLEHLSDDEEAAMHVQKRLEQPLEARLATDPVSVARPLTSAVETEAQPLQRPASPHVAVALERRQTPPKRKQPPSAVPPLEMVSSKSSRNKKNTTLKPIPEVGQFFRGSVFYFIPNNNVAAPRKLRIQRALEYGAVWERVWSGRVTHIIVDGTLTMSDVLKHFHMKKLPEDAVIVNDIWLTESIGYREMRAADAKRFRVQGSPLKLVPSVRSVVEIQKPIEEDTELAVKQFSEQSRKGFKRPPKSIVSSMRANSSVVEDRSTESNDQLDEMIRDMEEMADTRLDLDDDSTTTLSTSFAYSESDSDTLDGPPPRKRLMKKMGAGNQFMCMEKYDGHDKDTNPNGRTIEILQKMAAYNDLIGDSWRKLAYRRCVTALRRTPALVASKEDALQIPHVGKRLAAKIEEIVTTNTLRRLESASTDPNDQLLRLFMGIYQVGFTSASKWIAQGHRTLEDLKAKADLTPNQRIGVEHYSDFRQRISRVEVAEHAAIVQRALQEVDPALQGIVGGSYRRGNTDCGDIDMLITKEGASLADIRSIILETVVPRLTERGFLKAPLATATARPDSGSKWHGASALLQTGAPWRRIDLLFVPWSELGAALIYFTGNDIFNRSIRLLASTKAMRLNQRGLYANVMRGERKERMTQGRLLEGHSETKIFEILGVPWRPPEHRRC